MDENEQCRPSKITIGTSLPRKQYVTTADGVVLGSYPEESLDAAAQTAFNLASHTKTTRNADRMCRTVNLIAQKYQSAYMKIWSPRRTHQTIELAKSRCLANPELYDAARAHADADECPPLWELRWSCDYLPNARVQLARWLRARRSGASAVNDDVVSGARFAVTSLQRDIERSVQLMICYS